MRDRVVTALETVDGFLFARFCGSRGKVRAEAVKAVEVSGQDRDLGASREELRQSGFCGFPAVLVLGPRDTYVQFHRPTVQEPAAVRKTILYEVEAELPVPVEELAFDYADGASPEAPAMLAASPRSVVATQVEALGGLGLAPVQVIPSVACVADALAVDGAAEDGGVLGVHLGETGIDMVRLDGRALSGARSVPEAGGEDGLPLLARSFLVEAAIEGDDVHLAISGERSRAARVREEIGRSFGIEALSQQWNGLLDGLSEEERELLGGKGVPLVGAALQYFAEEAPVSLNLLPPVGQASTAKAALLRPVRAAGALLLALLLCWAVSGGVARHRVDSDLTAARARLAALWKDLHPGEAPPPDPVRTLRGELASYSEHGGGQGAVYPTLAILRRLVQLREGQDIPYRQVKVTADSVELEGEAASYAAVDELVADLGKQGLKALPADMESQGGRTKFRLVLQAKGGAKQ